MKELQIRDKTISKEAPCFIITEVGINHNNDLELAKKLIDATAETGCDAVKFQAFKAKDMYPESAGDVTWQDGKKEYSYNIFEANKSFETPSEWWSQLAAYAHEKGLVFFASVCDEKSADEIGEHLDLFKATSFAITHLPLLKHMARKGKPIMFSTGTATIDEIEEAYNAIKEINDQIIIMHCISEYPAPLPHTNMAMMDLLNERFPDAIVGYSDHTAEVTDAAIASIAHHAIVLEKHITLDRKMKGPDHFFALEPAMLGEMVQAVRQAEKDVKAGKKPHYDPIVEGTRDRVMGEKEQYLRKFARRSVMTKRAMKKGERITKDDIAVLRNANKTPGLAPKWYEIISEGNYHLTKDIAAEEPLQEADIEVKE